MASRKGTPFVKRARATCPYDGLRAKRDGRSSPERIRPQFYPKGIRPWGEARQGPRLQNSALRNPSTRTAWGYRIGASGKGQNGRRSGSGLDIVPLPRMLACSSGSPSPHFGRLVRRTPSSGSRPGSLRVERCRSRSEGPRTRCRLSWSFPSSSWSRRLATGHKSPPKNR